MTDTDELRRLLDEATPGPWGLESSYNDGTPLWQIGDVLRDRYGDNSITSIDGPTIKLIAAAVNALPGLLDERDQLRARKEQLEDAAGRLADQFHGAEAERDELRAEVERLTKTTAMSDAMAQQADTALAKAHDVLDEFVNVRGDFYEPMPLAAMVERLAAPLAVELREWPRALAAGSSVEPPKPADDETHTCLTDSRQCHHIGAPVESPTPKDATTGEQP